MKILHTSDWHLGKRLFKLDRTPEHEQFLNWLLKTLVDEDIDILLIAGDIFDTPTPPHQSLEIFYNFLHRVSTETKAHTLIIAGNHDSGLLLEAPSKILSPHRVKVWGKLSQDPEDHWIKINGVEICAIPFFRSYELLPQGEEDALLALKKYLTKEKSSPQILMLHHLAGVFEAAGSEQVISLSGVDSIPASLLEGFDYVALGHIHKPQKIGAKSYYSGSPIPLRFSETAKKSVIIIDVNQDVLTPRIKEIPKFRDLFIIKTNEKNFRENIQALSPTTELTPMAEIQIKLDSPKSGLIDEIKTLLSEKGVELLSYIPHYLGQEKTQSRAQNLFKLTPIEIFEEFYATKFPEAKDMPAELKEDFKVLLDKVKHASHTT